MKKIDKTIKDIQQLELELQVSNSEYINKRLPKESSSSKFKEPACSQKERPQALFFDNLITTEELAVIFGLAPQTIRNWVAQGKLPYVKLGRRNLFLKRSLQEWLNRKEKPQWQ